MLSPKCLGNSFKFENLREDGDRAFIWMYGAWNAPALQMVFIMTYSYLYLYLSNLEFDLIKSYCTSFDRD